ncbi:GspH/FimT family pseudopilin [Zhongshania arctica]|uniref:Type II secretion system protein H n=1 Tax=Zhongshania arctica TaxID=3238302 RepID=A0ABV3U1G0_9GAMM
MENRGFSLFELIGVLTITSILILSAVPAFYALIQEHRLRAAGQQLFGLLTSARATAVMRRKQITVWNEDGDWSSDVALFEDNNSNGEREPSEIVLARNPAQKDVTISGNRWVADYVKFAPDGSATTASGAFQVGTITVCRPDHSDAYQLIISIGGRVRMIKSEIAAC